MMRVATAALLICTAEAVRAQEAEPRGAAIRQATYRCERGVTVPVTYVNAGEGAFAVLQIEGRQVAMAAAPTGSGARYVSIGEQVGYRWRTKGEEAILLHLAADHTAEEEVVLRDCRATRGEDR